MDQPLSRDAFDALEQVSQSKPGDKPSACVARNAKHLAGIKLLVAKRNGSHELTEKGAEVLFIKRCIDGLRAVAADASTRLEGKSAAFLARKGYIVAGSALGIFTVTDKGRECLADIDASGDKKP